MNWWESVSTMVKVSMLAQISAVGAAEQGAVVGEAVDQVVDGAGVLQLRFTRSQGCCGEFVFRCDGGELRVKARTRGPEVLVRGTMP